jgi:hypothetical protein
MVLSVAALLGGMWAGLERIGWGLPPLRLLPPLAHGPLLVSGFLGTLISLERAVALRAPWAYAAPLLSGLGGVMLLTGLPGPAGPLLMTLGSLGLVAIFAWIMRLQFAPVTVIMELGAVAWFAANVVWLAGAPVFAVVAWFGGFLVLTIVGERLELSRLVRPTRWVRQAFLAAVVLYLAGLVLVATSPAVGERVAGAGMLGLALWLLRNDIARYTMRQAGLPRFIAVSLLSGYAWLGVAGVLWVLFGGAIAGARYDAMLHAVFLGFVFGMIFAHAPIILQAVLGGAVPYRAGFYGHLAVLNLSLILRLAGDLGGSTLLRQWGGLLGVVAILMFLGNTMRSAAGRDRRIGTSPSRGPTRAVPGTDLRAL